MYSHAAVHADQTGLHTNSITGIAFTDDLDAALSGLVATGLGPRTMSAVPTDSGAGLLSLDWRVTCPVEGSCVSVVMLNVPAGVGHDYLNTTSSATGTASVAGRDGDPPATAHIPRGRFQQGLPLRSGATTRTAQLSFTIHNVAPATPASGLGFTDDLDAVLTNLVAIGLPGQRCLWCRPPQISGMNPVDHMTGGDLGPGESCDHGRRPVAGNGDVRHLPALQQ